MARWSIPASLHSVIEPGPLCPFLEHSHSSLDGQVPRYPDSGACVRCIASLTEGRISLDIRKIHPRWRRRFLEFWSLVDVREDPDECWEWKGGRYADGSSSYFPVHRHWSQSGQFAAPRVAFWFTWGDIGRLPIEHSCGNKFCCNPLHMRVKGVPHFHHRRKLSSLDLAPRASRLVRDTQEFLDITREKAPARYKRLERQAGQWLAARAMADEA